MDTHSVISTAGVTAPLTLPFSGVLNDGLSQNVRIMGQGAAVVGSSASNVPPHVLPPPAGTFANPPTNKGRVQMGSVTVKINGKPAARNGDIALTCNDPADLPVGKVVATGTVRIG